MESESIVKGSVSDLRTRDNVATRGFGKKGFDQGATKTPPLCAWRNIDMEMGRVGPVEVGEGADIEYVVGQHDTVMAAHQITDDRPFASQQNQLSTNS